MKEGNGGLLLILGLVALGWWLRGRSIRRRMQMAYAPPPVWGAQGYPQSKVSAKKAMAVIVLVTGVIFGLTFFGAGAKSAPKHQSTGKNAGMLESLFGGIAKNGMPKLPQIAKPQSTSRPPSGKAQSAVRFAMAQLGEPYVWGGNGRNGWDCSGLTQAAWHHAGVKIPGTAQTQLEGLPKVGKPKRGDLIIYHSSASPSGRHVAIAVGQGQMVEARGRKWGVVQGRIRGGWLGVVRPGVR